jgi:circadian clock protein KaiC
MNEKVTIKRLATGVPGLDDVLEGGLPEYSFNLIAGAPGCGKTTLAHQMMFALAKPDRPALYFTVLGEPPLKMLRYQQQYDFFDNRLVNEAIRFVNLADSTETSDLDRVLRRIIEEVEATDPAFVFVDSFRSLAMPGTQGSSAGDLQHFVQRLGVLMTSWQATTFLIGEYFDEFDDNPVFTLADGLIWLRQTVQRNSVVRKMQIMKMRGQSTIAGLHTFRITSAGVEVFAPAMGRIGFSPTERPMESRMRTGVALLDQMLGGGLPRGYSMLVAGPSGSGKSILAATFLAEGVRCGENGVIAAFEPQPHRSRNRVIAELLASGRVAQVDSRAPDLSIDEVVQLLLSEIRRLGASRVVIDSLSGFELALAPTFRDDFRESLARMVASLASTGVTVLMTSELEDRYTDLRFSPYGTAFLTDAIVVQRYIELDSRLRRVIAVVKVRASAHSDELREYTISDSGIMIGNTLPDQEGLLGGRPTLKAATPIGAALPPASGSGPPR